MIGETSVSNGATTTVCTPVGAVFAAGDVLSWLAAGAQSVDWWSLNDTANTGATCVNPGSGLFNAAEPPRAETPYYGYLLAAKLARPGARTEVPDHLRPGRRAGLPVRLPDGKHAVAFINLDAGAAVTVTFRAVPGLDGTLRLLVLQRRGAEPATSNVETGTTPPPPSAAHIGLPPESVTVLETQ